MMLRTKRRAQSQWFRTSRHLCLRLWHWLRFSHWTASKPWPRTFSTASAIGWLPHKTSFYMWLARDKTSTKHLLLSQVVNIQLPTQFLPEIPPPATADTTLLAATWFCKVDSKARITPIDGSQETRTLNKSTQPSTSTGAQAWSSQMWHQTTFRSSGTVSSRCQQATTISFKRKLMTESEWHLTVKS